MSDIKSEVGLSSKKLVKKTLLAAALLTTLITVCLTNNHLLSVQGFTPTRISFSTNEKIIEEIFVGTSRVQLLTGDYYANSIIYVNITILPQSNSSVEITCELQLASMFSPNLSNVTLAPGEFFAENYTIVSVWGLINTIVYRCQCTLPDSNATILWVYEALYSAPTPNYFIGLEFWFVSGSFILVSIVLVLSIKKRNINKRQKKWS